MDITSLHIDVPHGNRRHTRCPTSFRNISGPDGLKNSAARDRLYSIGGRKWLFRIPFLARCPFCYFAPSAFVSVSSLLKRPGLVSFPSIHFF